MDPEATKMFSELLTAAQSFGPYIVGFGFFIWRDWKREERMESRMKQRDDKLEQLVTDASQLTHKYVEVCTAFKSLLTEVKFCVNNNTNAITTLLKETRKQQIEEEHARFRPETLQFQPSVSALADTEVLHNKSKQRY